MLRGVQWQHLGLIGLLSVSLSCGPGLSNSEADYQIAQDLYKNRRMDLCLEKSRAALQSISRDKQQNIYFRFRLLEAASLIGLKQHGPALAILSDPIPPGMAGSSEAVLWRMNHGMALLYSGRLAEADRMLQDALVTAKQIGSTALIAEVEARLGAAALRRQDNEAAEVLLRRSLDVATKEGNISLRTIAMGNLGVLLTQTFRLEEAVFWQEQAAEEFKKIGDLDSLARITGNLGWSLLVLGDLEGALKRFEEAESRFEKTGNRTEQLTWLGNIGNVHLQRGDYKAAEDSYSRALKLAREMDNKLEATWWLNKLASIAIARRDWQRADSLNQESAKLGTTDLDWANNAAAVAAGFGRHAEAEVLYKKTAASSSEDPGPVLNAHSGLAAIYSDTGQFENASREFRATLVLVEKERNRPLDDRFKLSYVSSLIGFYQRYVDFLVQRGDPAGALRVADSSHARLLSGAAAAKASSTPDYRKLAQMSKSVLLSYWLAPERSYLWEITASGMRLHELPGGAAIRSLISRHNSAISSLRNTLEPGWNDAGRQLWDILIRPVAKSIPPAGRVIVVPDGPLYSLNLDTLPVAGSTPHYWVEDATVSITPALRLLQPGLPPAPPSDALLLIGDPEPSGPEFPRLAFASQEVAEIEKHFSRSPRLVLRGKEAHPAAYRQSHPEKFSLVHFAAHASSSPDSPLQSAIVLSRYDRRHLLPAAEVMKIPLHARLVTISACGGAGSRIYSGEGLVGLTWAFQRAGAQAVVAGLWDVPDGATSRLMGHLYSRLASGDSPDRALRQAKLAMLAAGSASALPYNWAAFQHYVGSY